MRALLPLLLVAVVAAWTTARGQALDAGVNTRDYGGETALIKAATMGRTGHVRLMLAAPGVDASAADKSGRTALHHAALVGSAAMVHALLNSTSVDVNAQDADGYTPLYYAINGSQPHIAMALLDVSELDTLARDASNDTALHWAARAGHTPLVSAVLQRAPALLNAEGGDGRTALAIAVHNGHTETAMRLLHVPSVRLLGAVDAAAVLHCAAAGGHVALVRTVLAIDETDVNGRDGNNATALMAAVWAGNVEAADALLATAGVDVTAQDAHGRTALMHAIQHDDTELLRLILSSDGVDECVTQSRGGCAHRCVNTAVGYTCECDAGHVLDYDGHNCTQQRPEAADACGGRVTGRRGTITSPNYPGGYAPNTRCTWDIVAQRGHTVYLDFTHVDFEKNINCGYDYVEVWSVDALGGITERHGRFCASVPRRIASTTNHLTVVFASDGSGQWSGFAAKYFTGARCVGHPTDSECGASGGHAADCLRPPNAPPSSPYPAGI